MTLSFPEKTASYFPQEESMYSHNERVYLMKPISEIPEGDFFSLPILFEMDQAKVLFTEASLYSYPCAFLAKDGGNSLSSISPKYVLKVVPN